MIRPYTVIDNKKKENIDMIPSGKWFPTNLAARAAWFLNFATQFAAVGLSLGFTAPEIAAVQDDNTCFQDLASGQVELDAYKDAVRQYRINVTEGAVGEPTPAFPAGIDVTPAELRPTGIFQRLIELVDRIRAAAAYTDEIGALLGIIPSASGSSFAGGGDDLKPVIKVSASFSDFKFTANVTRLGQEAFKIQIQRSGSSAWTDEAFATSNPCEVVITPTTPGQPARILVRAILLNHNQPIGQPSDPAFVTVNP
jgi:hypothetical protein